MGTKGWATLNVINWKISYQMAFDDTFWSQITQLRAISYQILYFFKDDLRFFLIKRPQFYGCGKGVHANVSLMSKQLVMTKTIDVSVYIHHETRYIRVEVHNVFRFQKLTYTSISSRVALNKKCNKETFVISRTIKT